MKDLILKYVLENAIRYNGKANPGAIIGHILKEKPELRKDIKKLGKEIGKTVKEINKLPLEKQKEQLLTLAPELLEKKEIKEKSLPKIKKPVLRFEPSPSGALHIGHAYVLGLNELIRAENKGKLILRIGDTNPGNINKDAYKLIEEDAKWLANISKVYIQSDRMKIYYKYAEKVIKKQGAYVCTCTPEAFKKLRDQGEACPCRNYSLKLTQQRWEDMFKKFKPGQAVLRIKTDIEHKNPALRDWPAFRISNKKHPRKKYKVWPLMNFSVAIDDLDMKVTTTIRAKDHMDNAKKQEYLLKYLDKKPPEHIFVGRINFTGFQLSTTDTALKIKEEKYSDWDDIRLPFLPALRKRGYQKEALLKFAKEVGITQTDKKVSKEEFFKLINNFNTELIDKDANRYFFVSNPIKIKIKNAPKLSIEADLYPNKKKGGRKFLTNDEFYIQDNLNKENYRFMHLFNFRNKEFISKDPDPRLKAKLIHWLPANKDLIKTEILLENGNLISGLSEPTIKKEKLGNIVQFERNFFARLVKKEKDKLTFYFLHR